MNLDTAERVLIRLNDRSIFAGKVINQTSYGVTIEIEQTIEFPKDSIIFIPFISIQYIHIQK